MHEVKRALLLYDRAQEKGEVPKEKDFTCLTSGQVREVLKYV